MKRKYILQHTIALVLTYLMFAFVQAKINPFQWAIEVRVFMVFVNAGVQLIVFGHRIE